MTYRHDEPDFRAFVLASTADWAAAGRKTCPISLRGSARNPASCWIGFPGWLSCHWSVWRSRSWGSLLRSWRGAPFGVDDLLQCQTRTARWEVPRL